MFKLVFVNIFFLFTFFTFRSKICISIRGNDNRKFGATISICNKWQHRWR